MLVVSIFLFSFKQYSLQQLNNCTFVTTNVIIPSFMSYKCHQKRKIVHSQTKSFTHKETLDSINQSDVGLPHQIEKTKNKKQTI